MFRKTVSAFLALASLAQAAPMIETSELRGFDELPEGRRKLIEVALKTGAVVAGMPYQYGGNGAAEGGFDCSGAIYHVLRKAGLKPPRTSSDQYLWVREHLRFHPVSLDAVDTEHASFSHLKPGDLVFWAGTYDPTDGRLTKITHVAMFLGHEKKDGRAVMVNATNGRPYRGTMVDGYGVCDFRVPKKGGKSRMVGYGTPPGLAVK
jgi:peptidoglycan DL-endopeptidase CwlO